MLLGGQWETPSIARKIFIKKKKKEYIGSLEAPCFCMWLGYTIICNSHWVYSSVQYPFILKTA